MDIARGGAGREISRVGKRGDGDSCLLVWLNSIGSSEGIAEGGFPQLEMLAGPPQQDSSERCN